MVSEKQTTNAVTPITNYFKPKVEKFTSKEPRQKIIRRAIVTYIVKCSVALQMVERDAFKELISECEPRFNHLTR